MRFTTGRQRFCWQHGLAWCCIRRRNRGSGWGGQSCTCPTSCSAASGGLAVARRVLDPRLPVRPGWFRIPLSTNIVEVNAVLGGVVSVLPGSLAAGVRGGALEVHVLDIDDFDTRSLEAEERRVLRLFGAPVAAPRHTGGHRGHN